MTSTSDVSDFDVPNFLVLGEADKGKKFKIRIHGLLTVVMDSDIKLGSCVPHRRWGQMGSLPATHGGAGKTSFASRLMVLLSRWSGQGRTRAGTPPAFGRPARNRRCEIACGHP